MTEIPAVMRRLANDGLANFEVDGNHLAIPVALVREVNPKTAITPVPTGPGWVLGLMQLRGEILTVVDPGPPFGRDSVEPGPDSHLLLLKSRSELAFEGSDQVFAPTDSVAILVDQIGDVVRVADSEIQSRPANLPAAAMPIVLGTCDVGGRALALIDTEALLSAVETSPPRDGRGAGPTPEERG